MKYKETRDLSRELMMKSWAVFYVGKHRDGRRKVGGRTTAAETAGDFEW